MSDPTVSPYPATVPPSAPPSAPARSAPRGSGRSGRLVSGALLVADGGLGILASLLYLGVGDDVPAFFGGPVSAVQTVAFLVAGALAAVAFLVAGLATRGPDGIVGGSRLAAVGFIAVAGWQLVTIVLSRAMPYLAAALGSWLITGAGAPEAVVEIVLLVITAIAVIVRGSAGGLARFALLLAPAATVVSVLLATTLAFVDTTMSSYGILLLVQSLPGAIAAVLIGLAYLASPGRGIRDAASAARPFPSA